MRARIISLGEIVSPNIMKAIGAFTTVIAAKKSPSNPADIGRTIGGVLQSKMSLINNFKLGNIGEKDFDSQMISALEQAAGVKLTVNEFNSAWNAMHPDYSQFSALLNEAIEFNSKPEQKIIFISFTNPKDIRHLIEQLKINGIVYKTEDEQLTEIAGIKLLTTYASHKSKAELIDVANKEFRSNPAMQGTLASSMGAVFNIDKHRSIGSQDVKYIRSVNDIKDPILKEDTDKTNQEVEQQANSLSIETIIWKKFEKLSLSEVLHSSQIPSRVVPTSML